MSTLLAAAVARYWAGGATAIVCAWFGAPFLVLMGCLGAIVGGVIGFVQSSIVGDGVTERVTLLLKYVFPLPVTPSDLVPTGWWEFLTFGLAGAVTGAIYGAVVLGWMSLAWPWEAAYAVDPTWPVSFAVGQVGTAVCVGVAYVVWSVVFERWRLKLSGARAPSQRESELLEPLIDACAAALGLHGRPVLLVMDGRECNAYAGWRHLVMTRGVMDATGYDPDALGGVIAHELAHWRDGDCVGVAWTRGVALPLYWAYEVSDKLVRASRHQRPLHVVVRVATWAVRVTVERIVIPVQARGWRVAEFRADQAAVTCGHRDGLRRLLEHVRESFDGDASGWMRAICATHPPTEARLEALQAPGVRYPLGKGDSTPAWAPGGPATITTGW